MIAWGSVLPPRVLSQRYLLSGLSRDRAENEQAPLLFTDEQLHNPESLASSTSGIAPRTPVQKRSRLLRILASRSEHPGEEVKLEGRMDYPIAFARGSDELDLYLDSLNQKGWVTVRREMGSKQTWSTLTFDGWEALESIDESPSGLQAFVAMWFAPDLDTAFTDGIAPLGRTTGYEFVRVDRRQFNEKICDRIIAEINSSRFLIADVTGNRQGVYFEAGYAMGIGIPVIWTCRDSDLDKVHFDTRQYNHVVWSSSEELRTRLEARILATIGPADR
jgi:hypothetical protein